jgi:putative transposase
VTCTSLASGSDRTCLHSGQIVARCGQKPNFPVGASHAYASDIRTRWPATGRWQRQLREISSRSIGRDLDSAPAHAPPPGASASVLPDHPPLFSAPVPAAPDAVTNNAFLYCLIAAALRCEIDVLLPCAMSNHYHAVIYDRAGRYPEFIEHFHKLLARSQNALRGRWESLWSCEQTCIVKLIDREAVMDKLVYTATNPVQDHLVDQVHHWPGVNGLTALLAGRSLCATRPLHFFRPDGSMPDALELALTIPAELGPAAEVLSELRDRVRAVELECAAERGRTGRRVLGRRAVLAQSWRDSPASVEPRRNLRPGSRREARGRGSKRCCAIARLPRSTPAPAIGGEAASPPCSHPAPTGCNGSHQCRCSRPDLVRIAGHRAEHRSMRRYRHRHRLVPRGAWLRARIVPSTGRRRDRRGARRGGRRAARHPWGARRSAARAARGARGSRWWLVAVGRSSTPLTRAARRLPGGGDSGGSPRSQRAVGSTHRSLTAP